jgi:hypothetical protein|uniref:Uncharacterized protein n=1 Tax=viral metagenome TaxID=1070528 RepID=A0A6C0CNU5_9ZZZZ
MFVRNYLGKMVKIDISKYYSDKDLYKALWKIKYNIVLDDDKYVLLDDIIDFIKN